MPAPSPESAWIRQFHAAPATATRLVCFPYAGGSATYFFPLSQALSTDAAVLAVQYPGRQDRFDEACIEDIPELADRIADELAPWTDRPMVLFGHSMGAAVAFETALRLQARGTVPLALFVSGREAPSVHRDQGFHDLTDRELVVELARLNGTDPAVLADETLMQLVLPAVRGDYRALRRYRHRPGADLRTPIIALTGDADPEVDVDEVRAWAPYTSAGFRMRVFQGGHFFLADQAAAVQEELSRFLTDATVR